MMVKHCAAVHGDLTHVGHNGLMMNVVCHLVLIAEGEHSLVSRNVDTEITWCVKLGVAV